MVYDEYGYDAGPDGFGTDVPPGKGWALFGYYESEKAARDAVSFNNNNDDQGYKYAIHPNKPGAVIWRRRPMAARQLTTENGNKEQTLVYADDSGVYKYAKDAYGREPFPEDFDDFWEAIAEDLGSEIRKRTDKADRKEGNYGAWYVEVSGFGWRGQSGQTVIELHVYDKSDLELGREFIQKVLPKTDCTFYVYDYLSGAGLKINNYHHDAPTGEWYYAAPLDHLIKEGMWTGINNDNDEILSEIHEAVMGLWETEFLNKELSAIANDKALIANRGDRWWQGTSQRLALDIEGPTLLKKFLAQFRVEPGRNHYHEIEEDLIGFFEQYYASSFEEEWTDHLQNSDLDNFDREAKDFLNAFDLKLENLDPGDVKTMKRIFNDLVEYKRR